jgi:hypothetical protein
MTQRFSGLKIILTVTVFFALIILQKSEAAGTLNAPSNLWPTIGQGDASMFWLHIAWKDTNAGNQVGVEVQWSEDPSFSNSKSWKATGSKPTCGGIVDQSNPKMFSFYGDPQLAFNTAYYMRVRAYKETSYSDYSNTIKVATRWSPEGLKAWSRTPNTVNLSWFNNKAGEADYYRIERSTNNADNFAPITTASIVRTEDPPSNWIYNTQDTVTDANTYYYRVCGYSNALQACSAYTNIVSIAPNALPAAPSDLSIYVDKDGWVLARLQNNAPNAAWLEVEYSPDNIHWSSACEINPLWNEKICNEAWMKTPPGVHYYYRAYAKNAVGNSGYVSREFIYPTVPADPNNRAWYVDTVAKGTADGASWKNCWSLANVNWPYVKPGDTIYLSGGTYDHMLLLKTSGDELRGPVTIKASQETGHNGKIILDGGIYIDAKYVTIDGAKDDNYAAVIGNDIRKVPFIKDNINIIVNFNIKNASALITGMTIKWLEIRQSTVDRDTAGLEINGGDVGQNEIAYTWIHDVGSSGIHWPQNPTVAWDNLHVHHSIIERTGEDGITCTGGLTLHHSLIHSCLPASWGHPDGIENADPQFFNIYNNIFYDYPQVFYPGLVSPKVDHMYFYGNLIYKDKGEGANTEFILTYDYRHLPRGAAGTFSDVVIANNTIIGTSPYATGTFSFSNTYNDPSNPQYVEGAVITLSRVVIENNMIYGGRGAPAVGIGGSGWKFEPPDVKFDYNNIWSSEDIGKKISYGSNTYSDAGAFNNAMAGFGYTHNVGTEPILADPSNFDFSLAASDTSAKGKGIDLSNLIKADEEHLSGLAEDLLGNSRGVGVWDIGAYTFDARPRPAKPEALRVAH